MEPVAKSIHYETKGSRQEGQGGVGLSKVSWGRGGAGAETDGRDLCTGVRRWPPS